MRPEGDELAPQADDEASASGVPSFSGTAEASTADPPPPAVGVGTGAPFRVNNGGTSTAALTALWNDADRQRIRGRWQELQLRFIDDPHLVAGEAERLVQEAVTALTSSLDARRSQLHQQRAARGLDTENLRASLRDYREFLDRILGL